MHNRKTCKVRRISTGIESVLLAKALLELRDGGGTKDEELSISKLLIEFKGFAFKGVLIGGVAFDLIGGDGCIKFRGVTTVFSVDLDKILDMHEPGSVFSAIHFPLKQKILDNSNRTDDHFNDKLKYHPYFDFIHEDGSEEEGQVRLAGVLEVHFGKKTILPVMHYFRRSVEITELADDEVGMKVIDNIDNQMNK